MSKTYKEIVGAIGELKKIEIKPCPYCGAPAKIFDLKQYETYYISCENLECLMKPSRAGDTMEFVVEAWNKRHE